MSHDEIRYKNRTVYFRKSYNAPIIDSSSVLAQDAFEFVRLWLARYCKEALPFWDQAKAYHSASLMLPPISAPLTIYYCFLNCVKALLTVKKIDFVDKHGVAGDKNTASKRHLSNEKIKIFGAGVLSSFSKYMGEENSIREFSLQSALENLPYIHSTFLHTFPSKSEMFIPISNPRYRKHPSNRKYWFSAEIKGRFTHSNTLKTLPSVFEVDEGYQDRCVIRSKSRCDWLKHGDGDDVKNKCISDFHKLHRKMRSFVFLISSSKDLWYIKRSVSGSEFIDRSTLVIALAAMHRLSELSRYDPKGLSQYLDSKVNWLLSEFIRIAPSQFVNEIACEMTGLEMRTPGLRPE